MWPLLVPGPSGMASPPLVTFHLFISCTIKYILSYTLGPCYSVLMADSPSCRPFSIGIGELGGKYSNWEEEGGPCHVGWPL